MLLPADLSVFKPITDREILILQKIADGATSAAIAVELGTSAQTIKNLVSKASMKMGCDNRSHAIAAGFRRGILL